MLGNHRADTLSVTDVQGWHKEMEKAGKSAGSRRSAHRVLRQSLSHAVAAGYVGRNVAVIAPAPKGDPAPAVQPLTPGEVAILLRSVDGWRYEALVYVLLAAGLRIAEALGLTWGAVDLDAGALEVRAEVREYAGEGKVWEPTTKTGHRTHRRPRCRDTVTKLRAHRVTMIEERLALGVGAPSDTDVVFPNEFHHVGDRSNIPRELKAVASSGGLENVHPHKLPHTRQPRSGGRCATGSDQ